MKNELKNDPMQIIIANKSNYLALIDHIFLPKQLPGEEADNLAEHEFSLLVLIADVVTKFGSIVPKHTKKMFRTMRDIEGTPLLKPKNISAAIEALEPGEMFGLYIRGQNCGINIFVPKDESSPPKELILSTFEVSLRNEIVYSNLSDVEVSKWFFDYSTCINCTMNPK